MKYLINESTDPHFNMAFDEFCLEQLPLDEPVFYLWKNSPSVIIGLNQNAYGEVDLKYLESNGIKLARRVTGGGAVYHDLQNLNYTIVGRSNDLERDYPGYMTLIVNALRSLGVEATLSGRNDIMVEGRKVSGYAKRVWKDRLMVHGTLMYDVDIDTLTKVLAAPGGKMEASGIASVRSRVANLKDYLPQFKSIDELKDALFSILAAGDGEVVLDEGQNRSIQAISDAKFSTWEWNYGRSPHTAFSKRRKFKCGTIQADFSVERGVISELCFSGDFIGSLPSKAISDLLTGCLFNEEAIKEALKGAELSKHFDQLTISELTSLLTE